LAGNALPNDIHGALGPILRKDGRGKRFLGLFHFVQTLAHQALSSPATARFARKAGVWEPLGSCGVI
jgi:hypothetical protein